MAFDEKLADRIREILGNSKSITERKMFGGICFMLNGNMIGGVLKDDLIVKIDKESHAKAVAQKHVRPFDFTGKPMVGIIFVSPDGTKTRKNLEQWIEMGTAHARALPAKRKKKK